MGRWWSTRNGNYILKSYITNSMVYGTRKFNVAFTRALLSWIIPVSVSTPISLRSILTLPSHLHLGLPKGFFPVDLPVNILKAFFLSSTFSSRFNNPNYIRWTVQTMKFPILNPFGPKYSPRDPVLKYP